ncbi:MAG: CPBP family intramembrane metalloprotease [Gammaproteobacteria bacterium]|nr:CPBP family intramembrane metalloprotease [Gammaproteobacteria bacterium]
MTQATDRPDNTQLTPQLANRYALYYILISILIGVTGSIVNSVLQSSRTEVPYLISLIVMTGMIIWLVRQAQIFSPETLSIRSFSLYKTLHLFIWLSIVGESITAFVIAWFPEALIEILISAFLPDSLISWILFILMASIVAPIGEELIFRGFLFNSYASSVGLQRAVWLSALLFGLAHHSPPHVLAAFFSGLLFARFMAWGGSLLSCIVAHALVNFSSTLMMAVNQTPLLFPDIEATPIGGLIGLLIATIATVLFFQRFPIAESNDTPKLNNPIKTPALYLYLAITIILLALDILSSMTPLPVEIPG